MTLLPVPIAFACNDEHGGFTGKVEEIHVGDLLQLERVKGPALRIFVRAGELYCDGRLFKAVASQEWYGNMAWNCYWFPPETAAYFLLCLHKRGGFDCTLATEPLLGWWDRPTAATLIDAFSVQVPE